MHENADGIRENWPRIPLPSSKELLDQSAALGKQVAALLDTESPEGGFSAGDIRAELRHLGAPMRVGGGQLRDDQVHADLAVTAGWGHRDKKGVVMPGKGKMLERDYTAAERKAIENGSPACGLSLDLAIAQLGHRTCDVYLNNDAYWSNIPEKVWGYTIGGYQVIKKWLSYREKKILGRNLSLEEVRYVQEMVRRISAIVLLQPILDANYRAVKEHAFPWRDLKG